MYLSFLSLAAFWRASLSGAASWSFHHWLDLKPRPLFLCLGIVLKQQDLGSALANILFWWLMFSGHVVGRPKCSSDILTYHKIKYHHEASRILLNQQQIKCFLDKNIEALLVWTVWCWNELTADIYMMSLLLSVFRSVETKLLLFNQFNFIDTLTLYKNKQNVNVHSNLQREEFKGSFCMFSTSLLILRQRSTFTHVKLLRVGCRGFI